jgi:protease I
MTQRILMLVGDFVEDYEAMVPLQILVMAGRRVDVACPDKMRGESVATAIHDFEGQQTYSEKRGHNMGITIDWEAVRADDYDALVIPGGRAPEYLQLDERVLDVVRHFFDKNKPVAATCHGPMILAAAGVLKGRTLQAYPTVKPQVVDAGGRWNAPSAGLDSAHVDGRLVTAPAWPANPAWMRAFLQVLDAAATP